MKLKKSHGEVAWDLGTYPQGSLWQQLLGVF